MTEIDTAGARAHKTAPPDPDDGLGQPTAVPPDSWRERIRARPVLGQCYRVGVFVAGLVCIAIGVALAVLPGPLTIPPVLLGLWIWSTEFRFAQRFFDSFKAKAQDAWGHAKQHPMSSTLITVGGLAAAAAAFWGVQRFGLIDKATNTIM
jgi:hypothetical protein